MRACPLLSVCCVSVIALSCSSEARPTSFGAFERHDSAGIEITESVRPLWTDESAWRVQPVPLLDLAATGSGGEHEFFRVRNAVRLPDGGIAVANAGTNEVRLFGVDGAFRAVMGREGQGPGEFQRLTSVRRYRGDSLVAFDYWSRRITVLSSTGELARVASLQGLLRSNQLHVLGDGRFVVQGMSIEAMANARGRVRTPAPLVLVSADGVASDTIAVPDGYESHMFDDGDAGVPLGRDAYVAVHDDLVYLGDATELEFRVLGLDGAVRVVRVPAYDLAVPEAERDSIRSQILSSMTNLPPALRPVAEAMAAEVPLRRPAYSGLVVDSEGFVWLAPFRERAYVPEGRSPQPRDWLVFAPGGEWLGRVRLPASFELHDAGQDYLLGSTRDELGVESVQLLRLAKP